ncbi:integrase core domain-containing protein [Orrella sp. 11846]|uniref:integrase core domain-containing protein n=1 Tax=Orrella sp. 11846 TaxID=3409913 RepID=UPI003B5ADA6E
MSRKGDCWDNSPVESYWARVHGKKFQAHEHARSVIMAWITFYNRSRLHSSLGDISPMEYENKWYAEQRKMVA